MNKFSCAKEIYKIVIIRWSNDGLVGLRFPAPLAVVSVNNASNVGSEDRLSLCAPASAGIHHPHSPAAERQQQPGIGLLQGWAGLNRQKHWRRRPPQLPGKTESQCLLHTESWFARVEDPSDDSAAAPASRSKTAIERDSSAAKRRAGPIGLKAVPVSSSEIPM